VGGNIYIPPLPDLSRFYPDISRYFLSGGHSGIIRIYKIGQGSVGGNIFPPLRKNLEISGLTQKNFPC